MILAKASAAVIIGFNVRANPQARDLARRDKVEIRYYSIIYNVIDDMRAALSGLLAPTLRERFFGNASIREVFNITRVGKVAGCMVTEGTVRRGAKVRLLRDNVVIHEGALKTLKRFKDEVREVNQGYECGMAFENYQDIQTGDLIECFEIEEVARALVALLRRKKAWPLQNQRDEEKTRPARFATGAKRARPEPAPAAGREELRHACRKSCARVTAATRRSTRPASP